MVSAVASPWAAWHHRNMADTFHLRRDVAASLFRAQVENLYVEAMVLADEAYAALASGREISGTDVAGGERIALACESLKTTTRLMHVIAWLLHQRALIAGEPGASEKDSAAQLGDALAADTMLCLRFDPLVQRIVRDSERLFDRVKRLDSEWRTQRRVLPVHAMLHELQVRL
jgi:regulator of CtrA degradation